MNYVWDQYEELVLEFHSTFKHKEGAFAQNNVVSFSLGRTIFEMDMAPFAVASAFYTQEEAQSPGFSMSLRGAYSTPKDVSVGPAELAQFWSTISDHPFATTNLITWVRDLVYRYIWKILSTTLIGRKSGENKANWTDIFILMCRVENRDMNLASVLAWSLRRTRRGGPQAALDMGLYITHLALNLGMYDKYNTQFLHKGPTTIIFGMKELQTACIVTYTELITLENVRQGVQVEPSEGHPAADVMVQIEPIHRQRPRQRHERLAPQYPHRQPPPP
ncbi:hypothetical protein HanIR_Chr00c37g0912551 [Helianthus annuus]|nr:hypothetical protein HanIR_Chr17g0896021 [Helianthus annuus]KAJ0628930.1 hypothetical protein HanIR_Chr00c37g0912551 [Helianthus annuus]